MRLLVFTEVVKLVPSIDRGALNSMFQNLSARFSNVAKKFGDGMKSALKFGGLGAITGLIASKLLNPLQKAEELIDRILNKGDDAETVAAEFGSDAGKVLRLQGVARAKGLDAEGLAVLIRKFQSSLAKEQDVAATPARLEQKLAATTDPAKQQEIRVQLKAARAQAAEGGLLNEFIDEKDTVDAFFKFVQSLQKVDPAQQVVVQNEVFGERVRGKAAEFLGATDFAAILAQLPSAAALKAAATKAGGLSDLRDLKTAVRESETFVAQASLVNKGQIEAIDKSKKLDDRADNRSLERFDKLKTASIAIQELTEKFDQFATDFLANVAPELLKGINTLVGVANQILPSFKELKEMVSVNFDLVIEAAVGVTEAVSGVWEKGEEVFDSLSTEVSRVATDIQNVWAEFKSSKVYTMFGGK